jgi:hypothetical protein
MNAAAGERESAAQPRIVLEKRLDQLQKRLDVLEHAVRILTMAARRKTP